MARLFLGISLSDQSRQEIASTYEANKELKGVRWVPHSNYHITIYYMGEVVDEMLENVQQALKNGFIGYSAFQLNFKSYEFAPKGEPPRMLWGRWKQHPTFIQLVNRAHFLYTQLNPGYAYRKRPIPHTTICRFGKELGTSEFRLEGLEKPVGIEVMEMVLWESCRGEEGEVVYVELMRIPLIKEDR